MKKVRLSLALAGLILSSSLASSVSLAATDFNDIDSHWGKSYVLRLNSRKIIDGYEDGSFRPDNKITREEVSKIISGYLNEPDGSVVSQVTDIENRWSTDYVKNLLSLGLLNGYQDKTFRPEGNMTRAEAARLIYKVVEKQGRLDGSSFSFSDIKNHWARNEIEALAGLGIITGPDRVNFLPEEPITRAEFTKLALMADFLKYRMYPLLNYNIIGNNTNVSVEQMKEWARLRAADPLFIELAPVFYNIAVETGIDPAVIYAQSAKETDFMRFTGVLDASFKNPCGMKITAGGGDYDRDAHKRFSSWEEGIQAQADHLALYAGLSGYPKPQSPDPRHFPFLFGTAPTLEDLNGKWAPSQIYGKTIVWFVNEMVDTPLE